MGWLPAGKNLFVRRLAAVADVDRIFDNFARHLKEMVLQSARLRPVPWQDALEEFLVRVDGSDLTWWLYGSGALAVRGLDVDPGDLDFVVDDAQLAGSIFSDLVVEPVTRLDRWVAEWIGRAFHGALIEWIADAHPSGAPPGRTSKIQPPRITSRRSGGAVIRYWCRNSRSSWPVRWSAEATTAPHSSVQRWLTERHGRSDVTRTGSIQACQPRTSYSRVECH